MPEVDGWEILRALKAHEQLRYVPVILLTVSDDLQKGRTLGASAHLVKPVDRDVLLGQLDRILAGDDSREIAAIASPASV
jgi:CheY-like chemotaxis protein